VPPLPGDSALDYRNLRPFPILYNTDCTGEEDTRIPLFVDLYCWREEDSCDHHIYDRDHWIDCNCNRGNIPHKRGDDEAEEGRVVKKEEEAFHDSLDYIHNIRLRNI
jgi:hypothetical protein